MKSFVVAVIVALVAASANAAYTFRLKNSVFTEGNSVILIEPDDRLLVEVQGPADAKDLTLAYRSDALLRGDTIYKVDQKLNVTGSATRDDVTEKILEDKQKLALSDGIGNITIALPKRFGYFTLHVSFLDASGKTVGTASTPYVVLPKPPADMPAGLTGYDGWGWPGSFGRAPTPGNDALLARCGMSWVNFKIWWDQIEKTPGKFENLELLDKWIDLTRKQNAKIIMCLFTAEPKNFLKARPDKPADAFRGIWEVLMKRYGDKVFGWDVFNEKDAAGDFMDDVEICRIVHELKEKYCPQTKVIISVCTLPALNYAKQMLDRGAGQYLDALAWHPYLPAAPEIPQMDRIGRAVTLLDALDEMHQLLLDHKMNGDIYLDEWNYPLNPPYMPECDENDQANFMVRATILAATREYVKCLCLHAPFNGRLVLPSYPNLAMQMNGAKFVRRIDTNDPDVWALLFEKPVGGVVMPTWSIAETKLAYISGLADAKISDIYGNPISAIDSPPGILLRVSEAPIYIAADKGSTPQIVSHNAERKPAKSMTLTCWPKPNGRRNDPDDPDFAKRLTDGIVGLAKHCDRSTVEWQGLSVVKLNYDLGSERKIDSLAVNVGADGNEVHFPSQITFYAGADEDNMTKVGEVSASDSASKPAEWAAKRVGVDHLNRSARFVTIEFHFVEKLCIDEVFIK